MRSCTAEIFLRASSSGRAAEVTSRSTSRRSSNKYCSIASRMREWLLSVNFSPVLYATMALRTTSWRKVILPDSDTLILSSTARRQLAVPVFLAPAVVEVLARQHQVVDPQLLRLRVHAGVVLDRVLEREQHFHAGQALLVAARDRVRDRVDDEARADAGQTLFGRFGARALYVVLREAFHALARVQAQLLRQVEAFALRLQQARQDSEHR